MILYPTIESSTGYVIGYVSKNGLFTTNRDNAMRCTQSIDFDMARNDFAAIRSYPAPWPNKQANLKFTG